MIDEDLASRFARERVRAGSLALAAELAAIEWITDARVERLSQDFHWYSPVLARRLGALRADAVARPKNEAEIRAVVARCAQRDLPITLRGSGTGNYGQCMPLHGGVIVDFGACGRLLRHEGPIARAEAGIRMIEFDRRTQPAGWELRCVPSTFRSATLGGLYGGGFGGVGSINYGPLAAPGNVLAVKALTVEPEPRTVELAAPDALLLHHVYGTNGIVLELEVALAPAYPWAEAIVNFDDFDAAIAFASTFAAAPGLVKKEVALLAAPIPALVQQAQPWLAGSTPAGGHAVYAVVADFACTGFEAMVSEFGGAIGYRKSAAEAKATPRTIVEATWNHTTLHAMKAERGLTYIQSGFDAARHVEQAKALRELLGDEVLVHLEWIRTREGALTCSGLQLVRYRSEERLDELMQIHRDHGVAIANPHVYIVEDGKQGRINPAVVAMKARFDPQGLLNPGKLRGWDERDALAAAGGAADLATLPAF